MSEGRLPDGRRSFVPASADGVSEEFAHDDDNAPYDALTRPFGPPSPGSGEGNAPFVGMLLQAALLPPSPDPGEGAGRRMRAHRATPAVLLRNSRSLRVRSTDAERLLWSELRGNWLNGFRFVRQFPIKPYIADFACRRRRLVVELDGSQHAENERDDRRTAYLNRAGWSVLRFWNDEVLRERDAVCETILAALNGRFAERCDGAGLIHGLRFAPGAPSPASLRSAPSPDSGEGRVPPSGMLPRAATLRSSPKAGEGPGREMRE